MTKKIFKGIFTASLITMLTCTVLFSIVLYNSFQEKLRTDLKNEAMLISAGIKTDKESFLENFKGSESLRITYIESSGEVIYDSQLEDDSIENHSTRSEVADAFKYGSGESKRYSSLTGKSTVYYALRLEDGRVIRLAVPQNSVWILVLGSAPFIVLMLFAVIFISTLLSFAISDKIVKPINEINPQNPGDFELYGEIAPLVRKINAQNRKIKREKEKLSKSREEFRLITENMSEGMLIIDALGELLSFNAAAGDLLDCIDIKSGLVATELNPDPKYHNLITSVLAGENAEELIQVKGKILKALASPATSNGEINGGVIVILDVTEAEKREQLRREFSSNVSHELKTPLTSIFGISDMLASGLVRTEDITGFAEDIKKESARLINLIEDIIKLSRLDEGAPLAEFTDTDILSVANDVASSLETVAQKAKVAINILGDSLIIPTNPTVLREIIYNLTENAIKYNKPGGSATIEVALKGDEAVLRVRDTGIGIPPADLDRIFERFYRVDKSHSRQIGGTGLGLSIVRHSVAYLGGKIEVKSEENIGTCIEISFKNQQST